MKINRAQNAYRNIVFGMTQKIYQIVVPFLMRTVMIYTMGVQYLGLNSLFASVLQVLNLAELGVGSAMVYSMYKPIVEDDTTAMCALLKLYKTYYLVIGTVIAVVGGILTPFIPRLIRGNYPDDINIYLIYLLNLTVTVLSYWIYAYKNSILYAHQRTDIVSKIQMVTSTVQYLVQFLVLIFLHSYYLYTVVMLLAQVSNNIIVAGAASRRYPQYKAAGILDPGETKVINQRIKDLFTSKVGAVVVNSADTIVVSAFLGLTSLAIYQNYFYVLSSVIGVVTIFFSSCVAGIGNSLIVESKEKNFRDLKTFTFLISWIAGVCSACLLCLYQPFMKAWMGEKLLLPFSAVLCFVIYYYIYEINQLLNTYKDAGGIWRQDRLRPLVTAGANLCMNLIMVRHWGIYGVILSTVLSMVIVGMPWLIHNLFCTMFCRDWLLEFVKKLFVYMLASAFVCMVSWGISGRIMLGGWTGVVVRGIMCMIVPNGCLYLIFGRTKEFRNCMKLLDRITNGKLKLEKRLAR